LAAGRPVAGGRRWSLGDAQPGARDVTALAYEPEAGAITRRAVWKEAREGPVRPGARITDRGQPHRPRGPRGALILDALERLLVHAPMNDVDVEAITAEAGITRTRFYAYTSKNDALAALLRRMIDIRNAAYQHPGS
jgi:hypothetical protein